MLRRSRLGYRHHGFGPQGGGLKLHPHARGHGGFEGAHGIARGAGAAAHGRLRWGGPEQEPVQLAEGLGGAGRRGSVLHLLQGVQHHVRSVFSRTLPFQLLQLIQSSVHRLLYVLQERDSEFECVGGRNYNINIKQMAVHADNMLHHI